MTNVVLFSDASSTEDELVLEKLPALPMKSVGPYRIATEVRKLGFTCQVISLLFHFSLDEIHDICKKFIDHDTIIVGLSTTFWSKLSENKKNILKKIIIYTKERGHIKLIIGGTSARAVANHLNADACFEGYADDSFIQYLKNIKSQKTTVFDNHSFAGTPIIKFNEVSDFNFSDSVVEYQKNDCLFPGENVTIEIARGCIFKCDFCAFPLNGKKKFDYIKNESILKEEIIKNYENFGITNYQFADDTFNDSTYKIELLHKLFTSLPFKINFSCYLRADLLNAHREQIPMLYEMGLSVPFFGIETLNHESGKKIGKGLQPEKVKELLYDLKSKYWKNHVKIIVGLISGLPGETYESHKETADWILDEQYCLVDRIRPTALIIPNPVLNSSAYRSEFEINAQKYGFYWPNKNTHNWKNHREWVSSFEQASSLANELMNCVVKTNRDTFNGSMLAFPAWSNLLENPITLEDLKEMNRSEYKIWFVENYKNVIKKYINYYKKQILNL
jgi:radical SAM superfamily enzyme YgiQ (UPF0313 family)